MSYGSQFPHPVKAGQPVYQQPAVQQPRATNLPAGEHRRALGGIMLALWILCGLTAITSVCSVIAQVRAYQAQKELEDAKAKLQSIFKPS